MRAVLFFLVALLCTSAVAISTAQEKPLIPLPSDPTTAVITMDWRGRTATRRNVNPVLTILANGRVTVIDTSGRVGDKEVVLSATEVQDLLQFAIREQEFFGFDASDVQKAISAEFKYTNIGFASESPDTIVHIKTAKQEYEVSYNSLSFWAELFPNIKALGQLRAIELRLTKLVEQLQAGAQ